MGTIWCHGRSGLVSMVSEIVGFKAGVAVSRERMVELLEDSIESEGFFDVADDDEIIVRVRSEEVEAVVHELLFKLGNLPTPRAVHPAIGLLHRYKHDPALWKIAEEILEGWKPFLTTATQIARTTGKRALDPTPFVEDAYARHGVFGMKVALELFEDLSTMLLQSPWNQIRSEEWKDVAELEDLFRSESLETYYG